VSNQFAARHGADGSASGAAGIFATTLSFAVAFVALCLPGLRFPETYVYDEVYQAFTAGRYVASDELAFSWLTRASGCSGACAYEWVHPPLGKLILSGSILLFGDHAFAWRFPGVLAGAALIATCVYLTHHWVRRLWISLLVGIMLTTDGLMIVMSRTALPDIWCAVFVLCAYASCWRWLVQIDSNSSRITAWGVATGLWMGLAIATKWFGLLAWGGCGLALLWAILANVSHSDAISKSSSRSKRARDFSLPGSLVFVVIPISTYLLAHLPFFFQGYNLGDFFELLRQQIYFHGHLRVGHAYTSDWWTWPLLLRPVWFWTMTTQNLHHDIVALGSPVLWWTGSLAVLATTIVVFYRLVRNDRRLTYRSFVLLAFFCQWLPWSIPARPAFQYYILSGLPFMTLTLAMALNSASKRWPRVTFGVALGLASAAIVWTFWFFPMWTGLGLPHQDRSARLLLPGWI
jgi:dolichyl-phosphate-mannose-protein mannosyltransferase